MKRVLGFPRTVLEFMKMVGASCAPRFEVPNLGIGVGLRARHYQEILTGTPAVGFFEAISENYMSGAKKPLYFLDKVRERYPVVLHGVSLSIGGPDEPDRRYLKQLKALVDRVNPPWVTDHFCFSNVGGAHLHDLLPLPYTAEMVRRVATRARQLQDFLERPFGLENTSSYLSFTKSEMTEWEFVSRVAEEADIGLLFDVNNVYVSAYNHDFDPLEFIRAVPHERILQIHMAGHTNHGTHIIDTHSGPCLDQVVELYEETVRRAGPVATLLEWDEAIPALDVVLDEAARLAPARARSERAQGRSSRDLGVQSAKRRRSPSVEREGDAALHPAPSDAPPETLTETQIGMGRSVRRAETLAGSLCERVSAAARYTGSPRLAPLEQIEIYRAQFWLRHLGSLREDYPGLLALMGEETFDARARAYLSEHTLGDFSLRSLGFLFPAFLAEQGSTPLWSAMAELERAYLRAFDAPAHETVLLPELAQLSPLEWARARVTLAPSLSLLRFDYPVAELRRTLLRGEREASVHPEHLITPKRELRVVYRHPDMNLYDKELSELAFALLQQLADGERVGSACEEIAGTRPDAAANLEQNLALWFRDWAELGFLRSISR